ncbi:JAB domain-containing protein [Pseudoruminococcus massiliensis]|uniref:JAB domain-containing protein n=1 Tax=Pseudoruminococcus massiliensis TaxID=2086583 RepID=UPI00402A2D49
MEQQNKKKNVHEGHRERIRNKYVNKGIEVFEQHEILEMLLFYAIPRKNTNDIAHRLLEACGSLSAVFDAPIDILMQQGLSYNAAVLLHMIPDLSRAYQSDKFDNEEKIITDENIGKKMVHLFAGKNEECVYAFFLDAKGKEKYSGIISKGDASSAPLFSKDIVSIAARCKAVTVIIAHNHPSGVAFPSRADLEATADIADALDTIGIHLADHIIVADRDYISLSSTPPFSRMFDYDSE